MILLKNNIWQWSVLQVLKVIIIKVLRVVH